MALIQKISPCLWFNRQAEQAVVFYLTVFKNAKILGKTYYSNEGFEFHHMPPGAIMTIDFQIEDQRFVALNAGPEYQFTEAISFMVQCKNQAEIDYYWEKLGAGGDKNAQVCGWLKDRFGVSWQIVPEILNTLLMDKDQGKAQRVMNALLKMKKLHIKPLFEAFDGK